MVGIKHHTPTDESNNAVYDVSATAWEEEHDIDDAGIDISKIGGMVQITAGSAWTEPTGSGPLVMQYNIALAMSRFCWFDGTVWSYSYSNNVHIEQYQTGGSVHERDCLFMGSVDTTGAPIVLRATSDQVCVGIALQTIGSAGGTVQVLARGKILLPVGASIPAGCGIKGADSSSRIMWYDSQPVNEAGSGSYTIYFRRAFGISLTRAGTAGHFIWAFIGGP